MEGVGNVLSPEESAISLDYLMRTYNKIVSCTALLLSGTSITICITEGLQKLEPYYAGIVQEYRSYGEDPLHPCMRNSIPKIQCLIECLGVNHLWAVRLEGNLENLAEVLFKTFSLPYLGQVTGVLWMQEFCFLFNVSLCTVVDVTY